MYPPEITRRPRTSVLNVNQVKGPVALAGNRRQAHFQLQLTISREVGRVASEQVLRPECSR
jgi:hypothetical protein